MKKIEEYWKPIKGYEGLYEISSFGRVKRDGRILKPQSYSNGYQYVSLCKDGVRKNHMIHRLVAEAFLPNPNNYPQINHKDETVTNNFLDNLEWCTGKYNCSYGTRMKKIMKKVIKRKVYMCTLEGEPIMGFKSIQDAADEVGSFKSNIQACCAGRVATVKGYKWAYAE